MSWARQVLGLEGNGIQQWSEVCKLQGLPSLERLLLSGNQVSSIHLPSSIGPGRLSLHQQAATERFRFF